jgi:hypothetical protein
LLHVLAHRGQLVLHLRQDRMSSDLRPVSSIEDSYYIIINYQYRFGPIFILYFGSDTSFGSLVHS